jgi:hypothetical protein
MCSSIHSTISSGKFKCHQNFWQIEYPEQAKCKLSPKIEADGVLGIKKAIGVTNSMLGVAESA